MDDGWVDGWANIRRDGWIGEYLDGWMDGWANIQMDGGTNIQMDEWMGKHSDGWMDGRMDGQIFRWIDVTEMTEPNKQLF